MARRLAQKPGSALVAPGARSGFQSAPDRVMTPSASVYLPFHILLGDPSTGSFTVQATAFTVLVLVTATFAQ
jgi:hypothetical protein